MLEEAKKRDHRKLGQELDIFVFDDEVGPGLPLWLPERRRSSSRSSSSWRKRRSSSAGYQRVRTPNLTKEDLFMRSGHLPYYAESMYPPMELEGVKYYVKPMNCPFHHKIFAARPRSYRDLPMRLAEYGTCYRYEKSGELFGLMRVRSHADERRAHLLHRGAVRAGVPGGGRGCTRTTSSSSASRST